MKQFWTIFEFELRGYLKNKLFIAMTVIIVLIIAGILSFPRLTGFLKDNNIDLPSSEKEDKKIAICNKTGLEDEIFKQSFGSAFSDGYEISFLENDKTIKRDVKSGQYDSAIILESPTSFKYVVETADMYSTEAQTASLVLLNVHRYVLMAQKGMTEAEIAEVLDSNIDYDTIVTGKDQTESFLYTYAIIMVLYMVLLLYGQFVSNGVAAEKSSRAMEVLITSAKSINLMFGKVLGAGSAGLIQLLVILGSAYGFYHLNEDYVDNEIIKSIFNMPSDVFLWSVLFFILGFFMYAFMYGAAGSLATRTEDLNTLVMPITVVYMAAFMLCVFGMTSGGVDNTAFKVCTYLPTFAPMIVFVRICMGEIKTYEIIISIIIQIISIGGLGVICAKIYRAGVMMYGNTPKPKDIIKILKMKD